MADPKQLAGALAMAGLHEGEGPPAPVPTRAFGRERLQKMPLLTAR